MSWSGEKNSGFNNEKEHPWINLSIDYKTRNQETDYQSEKSIFKYTKELIRLRKEEYYKFFCEFDDIELVECKNNLIIYILKSNGRSITVALNFSNKEIKALNLWKNKSEIIFSNYKENEENSLKQYQAIIWETKE
jgi:glycosidase